MDISSHIAWHRSRIQGGGQYAKRPMYFGLGEPIYAMDSLQAYRGRMFQNAVVGY